MICMSFHSAKVMATLFPGRTFYAILISDHPRQVLPTVLGVTHRGTVNFKHHGNRISRPATKMSKLSFHQPTCPNV